MNRAYDCPSCGGPVPFESSVAVFAVCPHCRSMVVRHDLNVEAIGQMAQLPPDLSPLQIGARGEFNGQGFILLGRLRRAYAEGSWNEWFAGFGDGHYGWIAEAQGFFMVSFECAPPEALPPANRLVPGQPLEIEGTRYAIIDRKETVCLGSEGELPFAAPAGRRATSVDLTGPDGLFACIEYAEEGTQVFAGRYARFDDLHLSGLRPVPGWSDDGGEPLHHGTTVLQCPSCGASVVLRAAGFTMSAACDSCGSLIDTATPDLKLIRAVEGKKRIAPQIPLGQRGFLFDVNYEVIGFQRVKDNYSGWFEYLLFNPWQGFVWLVTYNGHWSFVRRLYERPEVSEGVFTGSVAHAKFNGERYRIFDAAQVSTDYVLGEFYWKVAVGMPALVTDFVHPPRILSREAYPGLAEETWSQGEYVEAEVIEKAFNLPGQLKEPEGIYLNQPNRHAEKGRQLAWLVPLVILALVLVQVITVQRAARKQVFNDTYTYRAGMTNVAAITPPFVIPGGNQALDVVLNAPVDNNWLELDLDLVNADTQQKAASVEQGVEYYHGNDDGFWSEGSRTARSLLPGVPPGRYFLAVTAAADPAVAELPFTVTVVRDVVVWSNFWIALVLLLAYPLYCWLRALAFERARWMDSDYSPYASAGGDDE